MVPTRYNNRKSGHYHSINHCKDSYALHLIVTIGVAPRVLAPHQIRELCSSLHLTGGFVLPETWKGRVFLWLRTFQSPTFVCSCIQSWVCLFFESCCQWQQNSQ